MAKVKDTPNLPGSSRMQNPSTSGNSVPKITGASGPVSKRVMSSAKGKGMKGSNPYCD
jgi:hypothetical protein